MNWLKPLIIGLLLTAGSIYGAAPVHDMVGQIQRAFTYIQQYQRIKYEIQAAQRLLKNLGNLNLNSVGDLVNRFSQFKYRIRSIGYTYKGIANQFDSFYNKDETISQKIVAWQGQSDDSIKEAMVSQGLVENSEDHMKELNKAVELKRKSKGDSDTLQAIGEINAVQSKQLADMTEIIGTDARAKNSVLMEERAKERERRRIEARLLRDFNEHKKSQPFTQFPSLGSAGPRS
jgi:P-type conjugative transfer protein TrbJ